MVKLRLARGGLETETTFNYDGQDRLIAAVFSGPHTTYQCDLEGNLAAVKSGAQTADYRDDERRLLIETREVKG